MLAKRGFWSQYYGGAPGLQYQGPLWACAGTLGQRGLGLVVHFPVENKYPVTVTATWPKERISCYNHPMIIPESCVSMAAIYPVVPVTVTFTVTGYLF